MTTRMIDTIAYEIIADWKNMSIHARPYVNAMLSLRRVNDSYGCDDARGIILYFLSNAGSWRGETAKRIKAELKGMLK